MSPNAGTSRTGGFVFRLRRLRGHCGGTYLAFVEPPDHDAQRDPPAVAPQHHLDFLADLGFGDDARQAAHGLDGLAVELEDDVADLDSRHGGGTVRRHAGDQRSRRIVEAQTFGEVFGHGLNADAEPAAPRLAELAELADDVAGEIRRHGKTDADAAAGRRVDRRVDADDLSAHVEQRTAGIAPVDRRVGLDEIVERPGVDVARARPR